MQKRKWVSQEAIASSLLLCCFISLHAQEDTTRRNGLDSFLHKQKGLIGNLAENLLSNNKEDSSVLMPGDKPFRPYRGRIIRNIEVQIIGFGASINDTTKKNKSFLIDISDALHSATKNYVIRKNLFFKKYDKVYPFLLAENERHFHDLDYLRDARIRVRPVKGSQDSVDIIIITKDVLSVGASFRVHDMKSATLSLFEDNFAGSGDRISVSTLFDNTRKEKWGWGTEYVARNIAGSFIDGYVGFLNFQNSYSGRKKDEQTLYGRLIKPLVHSYMRWTYGMDASRNFSRNLYSSDSLFNADFRSRYYTLDSWVVLNMGADLLDKTKQDDRLRHLIGLRWLQRKFDEIPGKYEGKYFYYYADLTAVLAAYSIFQQNPYRTQYIYGFGRTEDVPEGIDISLTGGWTWKNKISRPYLGIDFQRFYFTRSANYFNYTAKAGGYVGNKRIEDIDLLGNLDYFSRLINIHGGKWKQRSFLSAGITRQVNTVLNEPLFIESNFGLPEFRHGKIWGGDWRAILKAESVFYSPWSLLYFRFAPFVFGNLCLFNGANPDIKETRLFSSIGSGMRVRNESLIFGTLELKAYYFPTKNLLNETWRLEFNTNIKFKYNRQLVKRPELLVVN